MGLLHCSRHGWKGITLMTHLAANALDARILKATDIVSVELVHDDEISLLFYAHKDEPPLEYALIKENVYSVPDEEQLSKMPDLLPRCVRCVKEIVDS